MSQSYASAGILDVAEWQDWTPAYVNFTPGNGVETARFVKEPSGTVHVTYKIVFGSTTTIDATNPTWSMPVPARTGYDRFDFLGVAQFDDSGTEAFVGTVRADSTTTFLVEAADIPTTFLTSRPITGSVPMTWVEGDVLSFEATYEAAPV